LPRRPPARTSKAIRRPRSPPPGSVLVLGLVLGLGLGLALALALALALVVVDEGLGSQRPAEGCREVRLGSQGRPPERWNPLSVEVRREAAEMKRSPDRAVGKAPCSSSL
jgi:hypothetical protein